MIWFFIVSGARSWNLHMILKQAFILKKVIYFKFKICNKKKQIETNKADLLEEKILNRKYNKNSEIFNERYVKILNEIENQMR